MNLGVCVCLFVCVCVCVCVMCVCVSVCLSVCLCTPKMLRSCAAHDGTSVFTLRVVEIQFFLSIIQANTLGCDIILNAVWKLFTK